MSRMRPGDWITVVLLVGGSIVTWNKMDARLARLEEIAVDQSHTNAKLELSIKESAGDLKADIKEVSASVRRVETQMLKGRPG